MTAQPDNVRRLHPTPAQEALAEARGFPAGRFDRILADEALKPADTVTDAWRQLIERGDAVGLSEASFPGGLVHGLLARIRAAQRERDQARSVAVALEQQIGEALHVVGPFLRHKTLMGGLARSVQSALDPQDEPSPAA